MLKSTVNAISCAAALYLTSLTSNATVLTLDGQPYQGTNLVEIIDFTAPVGDGAWASDTFGDAGSFSDYWFYFDDDLLTLEYTLGNLVGLSFETNKPLGGEQNDFFIQIYTTPDGVSDGASWYGQRVTFDPRYASNLNAPANTWNTWSITETENILAVYDSAGGFFGGYTGPTFQQILDPGYLDDDLYSFVNVDYASEQVRGIRIATGTGWASSFEGAVDNVIFDFGSQGLLTFDLEPTSVDEPATLGLLGLFATLLFYRKRTIKR